MIYLGLGSSRRNTSLVYEDTDHLSDFRVGLRCGDVVAESPADRASSQVKSTKHQSSLSKQVAGNCLKLFSFFRFCLDSRFVGLLCVTVLSVTFWQRCTLACCSSISFCHQKNMLTWQSERPRDTSHSACSPAITAWAQNNKSCDICHSFDDSALIFV